MCRRQFALFMEGSREYSRNTTLLSTYGKEASPPHPTTTLKEQELHHLKNKNTTPWAQALASYLD